MIHKLFRSKLREVIQNGQTTSYLVEYEASHPNIPKEPSLDWTLAMCIDWMVYKAFKKKPFPCSCCGRNIKVYERKLNGPMAMVLCGFYEHHLQHPGEWADGDAIATKYAKGEDAKKTMRYYSLMERWMLIEHMPAELRKKKDGNPKSGGWRITFRGALFVEGKLKVFRAFWMYGSENFGFTPDKISIHDALRSGGFYYPDIMNPMFPDRPPLEYSADDRRHQEEMARKSAAKRRKQAG